MKHLPHYVSLIAIFLAGLVGFYVFSYDKYFRVGIAVALSASYVTWGVIHHASHKDICWTVIFEYIAVSILGLIMVLTLIFRA
ncbi:MAG: hypothetical protein UR39_C0001G0049 [Candidatus Woesebacteria bacterium GW2011_GWA1_33_30]|uniref:Uncharacterized protein n=1 Tax=Candidatus Woesebacteria bacterium GW2011_GWA2_33_28 TaxID=1618561 RepID=A0A0F9ZVK1_9BACT|nr:MAG: hypothetical protein UR38_C0001G0050 [Candidatus Woesebacteria bacterium GW2011_GWA2_33_28]KKP49016.1 MAG: hypothetical protein UR39_C0001G0049 [Candidatus Woesebacteria bacterium GW2011_GWA1_33_30]KKP49876.1 MAG: hypothetical protein UR40_C0003G0048 [Microgenomates group bacterium GW2011_GWC1_33_32]KKP52608.1 MAG: hypothetical protein UR44_C0001G0050 [Candidatus Woesebacteria bacterium GW2011_GWB1_33_38]KKP56267.1 MAG: hypothetical protein UR48_C0037G0005 [Microgenomates group bacteriu